MENNNVWILYSDGEECSEHIYEIFTRKEYAEKFRDLSRDFLKIKKYKLDPNMQNILIGNIPWEFDTDIDGNLIGEMKYMKLIRGQRNRMILMGCLGCAISKEELFIQQNTHLIHWLTLKRQEILF
jgi:hypothetical protein